MAAIQEATVVNKFYNVQSIEFHQEWMILNLDVDTYRIPIKKISKRLYTATDAERNLYKISPSGYGIHWPAIDEDLSVKGLISFATQDQEVA